MKAYAIGLLALLSLGFLLSCGSAPARTTVARTAIPRAISTTVPTATPDRDPFQVHFLQHYQTIACPARPNPTNLCYNLEDDASASSLGMISFAGTDILYVLPQDMSCGPAERSGTLMLADGDTITIHATGTYCVPGFAVQFNFTVTGGNRPVSAGQRVRHHCRWPRRHNHCQRVLERHH